LRDGGAILAFDIRELPKNPYSLGVVLKFLADHEPFSEFEFGVTTKSILHQLQSDCHIVAVENDQVAGYLGWVRTSEEKGRAWLNEGAALVADPEASALAVTVLAVADQKFILPMIRYAKKREPGLTVLWKRYYQDGRPATSKIVEV
jgi:hypothetical protein